MTAAGREDVVQRVKGDARSSTKRRRDQGELPLSPAALPAVPAADGSLVMGQEQQGGTRRRPLPAGWFREPLG